MKGVAILGSTGSIGVNALEVVAAAPERFHVVALAAGHNVDRLAEQVRRHRPRLISVADEDHLRQLRRRLSGAPTDLELMCGAEGATAVASHEDASVVLCAMVGAIGLQPTLAALQRGKTVAVANKEPLVMAGQLCVEQARRHGAVLLPVDSEHSAIFQSLRGHRREEVHRLLLTGSGGPFRTVADLRQVTLEQALAHPTWSMGPKITIDSATLMNKGLEVIEARWLFDLEADQIEVLIHPQSVVHSLVEYVDGSVLAQLGTADMRIPIAYALAYPQRMPLQLPRLDLTQIGPLTFEAPDRGRFPCLSLAYQALASGPTHPAVLNAANEVAVAAFRQHRISFVQIPSVIERTLAAHQPPPECTLESLLAVDAWARQWAGQALG